MSPRTPLGRLAAVTGAVLLFTSVPPLARGFEKPDLSTEGPWGTKWTLSANNRMRGEFANWFQANEPNDNNEYNFLGNRTQLGIGVARGPLSAFFQYQHTELVNVPAGATGVGSVYFANTRQHFQEQGWLRQGWIQAAPKIGDWKLTVQGGRMRYLDGSETVAPDANMQWVKTQRVAERLIGPFDFTHVGRSFDGIRLAGDTDALNLTGFALWPTSGGFEISAGRGMDVNLAGVSATVKDHPGFPGSEARAFWIYYHDGRPSNGDVVVLDARPLAERQGDRRDLDIHTLGANVLHVEKIGPGKADALLWVVGQAGDWQSQSHAAWAVAAEGGYQWTDAWSAPWVRAGFFRSSGDGDPTDDSHHTFFQLIPTPRPYALTPFYNLMNNQDAFAQLLLKPLATVFVRTDFHWLQATEHDDLLYFGGGATKQDFFGYGGTGAGGHHQIGYVAETSVSWKPLPIVELAAYYGHTFGGSVVQAGFPGRDDIDYGYLEATLTF
ncbi:MAG: hypothetical protein IT293_14765 [Deltaproteobacteria bacterium]|nr:hypothetical protein [Deltaproteobacteria bacterium]